jgi:hypothetical protein
MAMPPLLANRRRKASKKVRIATTHVGTGTLARPGGPDVSGRSSLGLTSILAAVTESTRWMSETFVTLTTPIC